ncbi:DUF927 domain-containing protein [Collimonas fungivorans]|uniref:DUF927 domain-containing protein n=1 Tax=Collimonas fungivorans TaxID=158899 RepID=UPI003FA34584
MTFWDVAPTSNPQPVATQPKTAHATKPGLQSPRPIKRQIKKSSFASATDGTDGTNPVFVSLCGGSGVQNTTGTDGTVSELDFVPWPYSLTIGGISRQAPENSRNAGKTDPIAGPLIVRRMTRGSNGNDYGLQIVAQTLDGKIIDVAIPATRLHGDPAELARMLADRGVRILPGREKDLAAYLDACRNLATKRPWMTAVAKPGWVDGDQMAFVLPDAVLGMADAIYQPAQASHMVESCDTAGAC